MSACISQHGEYSDHVPDDAYTCTRCGVLDEDALIAELRALRAERDAALFDRDEERVDAEAARRALRSAQADSEYRRAIEADLRAQLAVADDTNRTLAELANEQTQDLTRQRDRLLLQAGTGEVEIEQLRADVEHLRTRLVEEHEVAEARLGGTNANP